jgi:hypothetical protein
MAVAATKPMVDYLVEDEATLGECPGCGRTVAADAAALRYRGGFHHIACALRAREQRKAAFARLLARPR